MCITMKSSRSIRQTRTRNRVLVAGNTQDCIAMEGHKMDLERREELPQQPVEACAISDRSSTSQECQVSFVHRMHDPTASRRHARKHQATRCLQRGPSSRPTVANLLVALAMLSCILITTTRAADVKAELSPLSSSSSPAHQESSKLNPNDRLDLSPTSAKSAVDAASLSTQTSIASSLSSAVVSAAAAVAVAAAQGSLSGGDARSLLSGSHPGGQHAPGGQQQQQHSHHAQRSPNSGLNLAMKFADAIPEVPYSILHNMKKLDHAAPFYNVPNKMTGATKESGQSYLGSPGGAAEQLGALFRSPLWKRLADGYGEFTSEFRSLFRAPSATPMKGPTSATSKLLRDISVPALLVLLASTMPGDWRPVRTRRKSFAPADIPPAIAAAAQMSRPPTSQLSPASPFVSNFNNFASGLESANGRFSYPENGQPLLPRQPADVSLQAEESNVRGSWLAASQAQAVPTSGGQSHLEAQQPSNLQPQPQYQLLNHHHHHQQQQPPQSIRRSGEVFSPSSAAGQFGGQNYHQTQEQRELKPVKGDHDQKQHATGSLLSSLTSGFVHNAAPGKLMSRILNANFNNLPGSYRMMGLLDGQDNRLSSSAIKRSQLSDGQRYTLIGLEDGHSAQAANANEQEKLSPPSSKPFLLSAMTHAITSMLNQQTESGSSSPVGQSKYATRALETTPGDQRHCPIS